MYLWLEQICSSLGHGAPAKVQLQAESLHQASPDTPCSEAGREVPGIFSSLPFVALLLDQQISIKIHFFFFLKTQISFS